MEADTELRSSMSRYGWSSLALLKALLTDQHDTICRVGPPSRTTQFVTGRWERREGVTGRDAVGRGDGHRGLSGRTGRRSDMKATTDTEED